MSVLRRHYTLNFSGYDIINFWLVGGLSLVFLIGAMILENHAPTDFKYKLGWWAYYAAFAVNYPHFAHSYQLFYKNFDTHLVNRDSSALTRGRFFMAGIIVPMALALYFYWSYLTDDAVLLGWGVSAMYFFVGWHYVKQGYGVLITMSVYKRVFYERFTKQILIFNAYAVWAYAWLKSNSMLIQHKYFDVPYSMFDMPDWTQKLALFILIITTSLSLYALMREWIINKKQVSINGLTGYISATYLWVVIPYINPYFFLFVPFFHSLQYLPFVYKYKAGEISHQASDHGEQKTLWYKRPIVRIGAFAVVGIILGGLFMDFLPKQIDKFVSESGMVSQNFSQNFFLVSFLLFINIHHYFIDNAFWRKENKTVQKFLFGG